jgi:hypothetical protein
MRVRLIAVYSVMLDKDQGLASPSYLALGKGQLLAEYHYDAIACAAAKSIRTAYLRL